MKTLALVPVAALSLAGCVVRTVTPLPPPPPPAPPPVAYVQPAPPPPAPVRAYYFGQHALPGGAWCYIEGSHEHDFYPEAQDQYVVENGYYLWRGPLVVTYYAGHPLPGGGWCTIVGPHRHGYFPPRDTHWLWRPGQGYVYQGPYSHGRPPPPHYWARPTPVPVYRAPPTPAPRFVAPAPPPARVAPGPAMEHHDRHVVPAPGPAAVAPAPPAPPPPPGHFHGRDGELPRRQVVTPAPAFSPPPPAATPIPPAAVQPVTPGGPRPEVQHDQGRFSRVKDPPPPAAAGPKPVEARGHAVPAPGRVKARPADEKKDKKDR